MTKRSMGGGGSHLSTFPLPSSQELISEQQVGKVSREKAFGWLQDLSLRCETGEWALGKQQHWLDQSTREEGNEQAGLCFTETNSLGWVLES